MNARQDDRTERNPAEIYDELFVPALFAQWGPRVAAVAAIDRGERVLDVGCGTGVLACAAAERVGPGGQVVGLDPNAQMLAVAARKPGGVVWKSGRAEALPFDDASFDAVISQFALMFVESKSTAIAEMLRVLRPRGRLVVAVWDSLDRVPGYLALTKLLEDLFGADTARAMHAPFTLGDKRMLSSMFKDGGLADTEVQTHTGKVCFESIDAMINTEHACVWTLGGILDAHQFARLRQAAREALRAFVQTDGRVAFDCPAQIVIARKQ